MPHGSEVQVSLLKGPQVWTFLYTAWLRGPDISQNTQHSFKKYPQIDYRGFAFSSRHYAAANRTARGIPHFGPFWVVRIQGGGQCPPDKNIPVIDLVIILTTPTSGAYPGFSEGGGGRDPPKKLTSQTSAHAPIRGQCLGPTSVCFVESSIFTALV